MTIPKGYKQTELGIIPEDWLFCTFQDVLTTFSSGATPYRGNADNYKGNIRWISSGELNYNRIYETLEHISKDAVKNTHLRIHPADTFLMAITGLEAEGTRGRCAIVGAPSTTNQSCLAINGTDKMCVNYLFWFYKSWGQYLAFKYCQGTKQQSYTAAIVKKLPIYCPPSLPEQQAIAEALSDVDALIAALDKKIEKKRLIKQGTMQELLTGKKRLKGFTEEWVEVQVQDVFEVTRGYVLSSRNTYPLQTGEYIYPVYSSQTSNKGILGYYNQYLFEDCITWTTDGANAGDVNFRKGKFYCTNVCGVLKNDLGYSNQCVAEILNMVAKSYVSYIGNPKLMNQVMATIAIRIPNTIQEQQSIAAILSDMDKEIAELEARREKYQQLKSGMMQKLLTGQIRLVKPQTQPMSIVPTVEAVSIDAVVTAAHIVNKLHRSKGWGRTKMQKALHLVEYGCQLDFNHQYIRNTAGPDDQQLLKHIDNKFKQYRLVDRRDNKDISGHIIHYDYVPAAMIDDAENAFAAYPLEKRNQIDALLEKIKYLDLAEAEIVSTLYAVWNNRLIKREPINDKLLLEDFYAWSEHKSEYKRTLVEQMLRFMRKNNIVPTGWGKYIDCKI